MEFPELPLEEPEFEEPKFSMKREARCLDGVPVKPKGARVLVVQNKFRQKGRIIVPDTAQQMPTTGRVVAIGPDVPEDFVSLDEQVVFSRYAGVPYTIVDTEGNTSQFVSLSMDEIAGELMIQVDKLKLEGE
jgi:co-chaperonin GroES (HSP10)